MGRRLDPQAGFTLIELMIAITVLALLTTTLTLSVSRPRAGNVSDVSRFQAVHALLREQAVLSRQVLGLRMDADGYQRLRWVGEWVSVGDAVRWRGEVAVLVPFVAAGPVQFAPSGQASALRVRFSSGDRTTVCESGAWGHVTCRTG